MSSSLSLVPTLQRTVSRLVVIYVLMETANPDYILYNIHYKRSKPIVSQKIKMKFLNLLTF